MKVGFKFGMSAVVLTVVFSAQSMAVSLDSAVPLDQTKSVQQDQDYLKKLQYQNNPTDVATAKLLKIKGGLTAEKLQSWLDERVSLVVSEEMNLQGSLLVAPGEVVYPEADLMPKTEKPKASPERGPIASPGPGPGAERPKPVMVMANIGAAVYMMGKQNKVLLALRKSDGSILPLTSPHHGFIQIGSGLFLERFRVNPVAQDAPANSVSRLSTFFHESRHSDGHGESLGFMHAICPEGHPYAGYPACDKNLNGPYTVGAQVMKSLSQACGECSTKEKAILKMIEADSRSRIMKKFPDETGKIVEARNLSDTFEQIKSFKLMTSKPKGIL
jgi:hypothetical protein